MNKKQEINPKNSIHKRANPNYPAAAGLLNRRGADQFPAGTALRTEPSAEPHEYFKAIVMKRHVTFNNIDPIIVAVSVG